MDPAEIEALLSYYPARGGVSRIVRALVSKHLRLANERTNEILSSKDFESVK